jgi:hypothetical protein
MLKVLSILALGITSCLADVQIKTSYNADGQAAETTIWSNGTRMRYDYGNGVVMLRYCAQKKMIQLDDKNKSFLALPLQDAAKGAVGSTPEVSDTGERKELFGHQARHLKIVDQTEGKDGKKERTETDGWYLDLRSLGACFEPAAGVEDRGYPASYTILTYDEKGKPAGKVTMQIVSMAEVPPAGEMFEVPADYKDTSPREVPKSGSPKAPGAVRIAALPVHDRTQPGGRNEALFGRLVNQLMEAKLDLVQFEDGPEDVLQRRAEDTASDYLLYTEVTSVDKPATGKAVGLLHKAPGIGHVTGGDGMEAHIDYRLVPPRGGTPVLASSAIAKAGTAFNVKGAVLLAANFVPMAMAAKMFSGALNPAMMNALVSGKGSGAALANCDPMMGGLTSLIRMAMPGQGQPNGGVQSPQAQEALATAIDMEGKAIIAQIKPAAK